MGESFYRFLTGLGYSEPIHPTQVHMPIGLVIGAVFFILAGLFSKRGSLTTSARHCLVLAFIWFFPTVLLGIIDWQHYYHGAWIPPIRAKLTAAPVLGIVLLIAIVMAYKKETTVRTLLVLTLLCLFPLGTLGYFGGKLVFARAGLSSRSSPAAGGYQAGADLFRKKCAACHPGGKNSIKPEHPIIGSPELRDQNTFTAFLRNPPPPMPKFPPSAISDTQATQMRDYITHVLEKEKSGDG